MKNKIISMDCILRFDRPLKETDYFSPGSYTIALPNDKKCCFDFKQTSFYRDKDRIVCTVYCLDEEYCREQTEEADYISAMDLAPDMIKEMLYFIDFYIYQGETGDYPDGDMPELIALELCRFNFADDTSVELTAKQMKITEEF